MNNNNLQTNLEVKLLGITARHQNQCRAEWVVVLHGKIQRGLSFAVGQVHILAYKSYYGLINKKRYFFSPPANVFIFRVSVSPAAAARCNVPANVLIMYKKCTSSCNY